MNQKRLWNQAYKKNIKWRLETKQLPKILTNKKVLELGVGNGKTLRSILAQKPKEAIALDFSKEALNIVNKEFPKVKTIQANLLDMPFKQGSFDLVICYFTLNNLVELQREKAIKEIQRVLKKEGILLFQDFFQGDFRQAQHPQYKEENTIQKSNEIICHFFTKEEVKTLFGSFSTVKITITKSSPIRNKPKLQRKTIFVKAVK